MNRASYSCNDWRHVISHSDFLMNLLLYICSSEKKTHQLSVRAQRHTRTTSNMAAAAAAART